jgi:hypothetical protein
VGRDARRGAAREGARTRRQFTAGGLQSPAWATAATAATAVSSRPSASIFTERLTSSHRLLRCNISRSSASPDGDPDGRRRSSRCVASADADGSGRASPFATVASGRWR